MELLNIYETYTEVNNLYTRELEHLVAQEVLTKDESTLAMLKQTQSTLEDLMARSAAIEVSEDNGQNLEDLRYLLTDSYFLAMDLTHFYEHEQMGRFKMRAINHLNKKRRAEVFG
ncbi:MAG: hypothetical protein ACRCTE_00545 [Cellulosilyticaceae bacterium]